MSESLAPASRRSRAAPARGLRIAADETLGCIYHPRAEAAVLLSQLMVRLQGVALPVVQFIQASPGPFGAAVARSFAEAALPRLGRTLLVTSPFAGTPLDFANLPGADIPISARRRTRKSGCAALEIAPDSVLRGLYHARIGGETDEAPNTVGLQAGWLSGVKLEFRLVVIDGGAIEDNPLALEWAARCHGCVLSVAAGETSLSNIQASVRQVHLAGGTIFGTVLYDASPAPRHGARHWFGRARRRQAG